MDQSAVSKNEFNNVFSVLIALTYFDGDWIGSWRRVDTVGLGPQSNTH